MSHNITFQPASAFTNQHLMNLADNGRHAFEQALKAYEKDRYMGRALGRVFDYIAASFQIGSEREAKYPGILATHACTLAANLTLGNIDGAGPHLRAWGMHISCKPLVAVIGNFKDRVVVSG